MIGPLLGAAEQRAPRLFFRWDSRDVMTRNLMLLLVGLALATAPLRAAAQPSTLTLDDAVAEALRANFDVLRSREQLQRLGGQVEEVRSVIYPQVGLETNYRRSYDESILDTSGGLVSPSERNNYALRTTLEQLVFSWGKVSSAIRIAEDSVSRGEQDIASTERQVKLAVHEAFYGLLLAYRLVEVAEETVAQRKRQLDVAEKRFEAGVVNEFEVIRARVDVANAQTPLIQVRNRVRRAEDRLNNLLARPQGSPLQPVGRLSHETLDGLDRETVVERAIRQRPELEALRVSRSIAEENLTIARAEDKPEINLAAEYGYAAEELDDLNANRERWSAGVFFRMPLFDGWRTRGLVAQARSGIREVDIALSQLEERVTLEAKATLDDLAEAEEIIDSSSMNIGQAEKALELAETSYQYGVATFLDVSDARLGLTVAQRDHAVALHDYMVARARVLSVMNEL